MSARRRSAVRPLVLPFLWLAALLAAGAAQAQGLVVARAGDMPVILTAPHGGRDAVPGCEERTPRGSRFVNRPDGRTDALTLEIAAELTRLTGKQPYVVVANFHRKFIDANRAAHEAYDSPACAQEYERYHAAVRRFVDEARGRFPHAVLFDVHGQSAYRDSILRGTRHGDTVARLLARAGAPAVTGPESVFGQFAAMGYRIVPPNDISPTVPAEAKNYAGGHTVAIYGSHRADGIDAIQLEYGIALRDSQVLDKTAKDSAKAIAVFYERFLKTP